MTIFSLIVLLFSVAFHEAAHGFLAYKLGDPTAKYEGRLSLNPFKHLDLFGSILLPLFTLIATFGRGPIFGFAKPVPINPYNFRDQRWGELKVALAGPTMNFLIATAFGLLLRFFLSPHSLLAVFLGIIIYYNFLLGIFNLVPIPPLDGSHILFSLLPERAFEVKLILREYGLLILILFIFFGLNLIDPLALKMFRLVVGRPFRLFSLI